MGCRSGLWKAILLAAFAALSMRAAPALALVTIEGGTSVTFAWAPASGDVLGYYVIVKSQTKRYVYSIVYRRNWETVVAEPNETISVTVIAFDRAGNNGPASSASEPVLFAAGGSGPVPAPIIHGREGDLDSDGFADLILQAGTGGQLELKSMRTGESSTLVTCREKKNGTSSCRPARMNGNRWMIVGNGDYDGDGVADILFRRHRNGVQKNSPLVLYSMNGDRVREISKASIQNCVERSNGSTRCRIAKVRAKNSWQIVGSGDYNGDGRSDVLLQSASDNQLEIWAMTTGGYFVSETLPDDFGNAAEVIASGDFDGDGTSDILWRDLETGAVDIWGLTKDSTLGPLEGAASPWAAIGAGDFDGDGRDDVLLRELDTDRLAVRLSSTGRRDVIESALNTGARERQVVSIGDYDGNGVADLVVYGGGDAPAELWLMDGALVTGSESIPAPPDSWTFATTDLRPPGSR